jgi:hypothetical protein
MTDPHEGRGYDFELHHDLNRGTQLLEPEKQEVVEKARSALLYVLGILTCESPPKDMSDSDVEMLSKWLQQALHFRNIIRSHFDDIDTDSETVH